MIVTELLNVALNDVYSAVKAAASLIWLSQVGVDRCHLSILRNTNYDYHNRYADSRPLKPLMCWINL